MPVTTPPPVSPLPAAPDRGDRATFSSRATAMFTALKDVFVAQINAVAANVFGNAQAAESAATAASSSATAASSSATASGASATNAASSAAAAAGSATAAETSAGNAATSAFAAGASAAAAAASALDAEGYVASVNAAATKATPVDADVLGYLDSAAFFGLVQFTFGQLKTWLAGLFVGKTGDQSMTGVLTAGGLLSNAGVIGYGVGAGGTTTQPTSLATNVFINKPSGAITLFSAIPPGGDVVFQVLNSYAVVGDVAVVTLRGSLQAYSVEAESCSLGGFRLRVRNSGGGTYALVPVIDFEILKSAKS